MACSSTVVKDFFNIQERSSSSCSNKKDDDSSVAEDNDNELLVGGSSLKLRKGMFQTMDLFQKNVFTTNNTVNRHASHDASIGKTLTMMKDVYDESRGGGGGGGGRGSGGGIRKPPTLLIPPKHLGGSRPPSLLERSLLPGIKRDLRLPTPSFGEQSETAQLTIFYAGLINVYDDVPADKAQAIMLLANQCSVAPPTAKNVTKVEEAKPIPPSFVNSPEDLPIARRHSLRRFLEKRRGRIMDNFPYTTSNDK